MWFGKKAAEEAVKGVGGWIDEQQFTKEEQVKYKLQLFEVMGPFKTIQRTIVTWVMYVWASYAGVGLAGVLFGYLLHAGFDVDSEKAYSLANMVKEYAMVPFIWTPCLGVFTLYLSGGVGFFKGGKK